MAPVIQHWAEVEGARGVGGTTKPHETSSESVADRLSIGHSMLAPFTSGWQQANTEPLIIAKGEGVYVWDKHGKKYLDALGGLWCTSLGFSEKRLVNAATEQLNTLPFYHSFWNRTTQPSLDLARELIEMFKPVQLGKVFFCNSGSEANDTQVKLVWYYNNALGRPKKKKIIARQKAEMWDVQDAALYIAQTIERYHGSTLIAASLSGLTPLHQGWDLPKDFVLHTDCPHYWRYHLPNESEEEFSTRLAENLEKLILKEGPETIAAFIAEPVMGAGGVLLPPATYFDKIQLILKKYDILLIADEVICGFGRLGTMFGCEKYGIKPDLVSIAKALSSAYMPIGAVLMAQHVFEAVACHSNSLGKMKARHLVTDVGLKRRIACNVIGIFAHGFTNSGHPVSSAVALETLRIYKEREILVHVNGVAPIFQEGMKDLADSPIVGEIRGTGLVLAIEFTADKQTKELFPVNWVVGTYFAGECTAMGMLVRVSGDIVMMAPPLIITPTEIHEIIQMSGAALKVTEKYVAELQVNTRKV